jgi:hypothetical protein
MDGILAPVLQITPELHELCEEYSVPEDMIRRVEKSMRRVSIWGRKRKKGVARKLR